MSRTRLSLALVACLAGLGWLTATAPQQPPEPPSSSAAAAPQAVAASSTASAPQRSRAFEDRLSAWRDLHGPIGYLSQEETEALIAARQAQAASVAAAIAAMDAAALEGVLAALRTAERLRDKLVMIEGLGQNPSREALSILEEIYETEDSYTLRSNVIRALGDSPAEGHTDLLVEALWDAEDERLQQLSAQGLYGEAGMEAALAAAMSSTDLPLNVRLEAVHSLSATGSEAAQQLLEEAAASADNARLRRYAEKELLRSFG